MVFADLHIHSRYSFNCSAGLDIKSIGATADLKGLNLIGTGDVLHPLWKIELQENLRQDSPGIFSLEGCGVKFLLSVELSCIYKREGITRKVHVVVIFPSWNSVERFRGFLLTKGAKLDTNGRPFIKEDVRAILEFIVKNNRDFIFFPAHIWTPWYSILGAKSGFESIDSCFGDLKGFLTGVETGLSSDEKMNRTCSFLDPYTLISCSDAHSTERIGRNCTIIDTNLSFTDIANSLKKGGDLVKTVDTYPETGKYFWDGHRKCGVSSAPGSFKEDICPICFKPLTTGVLHRVEFLADREPADKLLNSFKIVPLKELIATVYNRGINTKTVSEKYKEFIKSGGTELAVLLDSPIDQLKNIDFEVARSLEVLRRGDAKTTPGSDGVYGKIEC